MRRRGQRWLLWGPIFAVGLFLFLASLRVGKSHDAIVGDAVGYYLQLQSVVVDGDLDYGNQLRQHAWALERTRTGKYANMYPAGTAVLDAPFFLVGRAVAGGGDGFSPAEQIGFALGSIFWAAVGLELAFRLLRRLTGEREALLGATGWLVASALPYYIFRDAGYAHACSFFAVAALLWYDEQAGPATARVAFTIGLLVGVAMMVENQNVLYAVVPLWRRARELASRPLLLAPAVLGAVVGFLPQMIVWQAIYGAPIVFSYAAMDNQARVQPLAHLHQVLFSTNHGLILWHPIAGLAIAGLVLAALRAGAPRPYLAALVAQWLINGSWWFWSFGYAFGSRKFLSASAIFMLGLAYLARRTRALWVAVALLAAWNAILALLYTTHAIPPDGEVTAAQLLDGLAGLMSAIRGRL